MVAYPFLPHGGAAEKYFQQQDTPPLSFLHLNTTFDNTSGCDSDMAVMSLILPIARRPISRPGYTGV
jgi:hypothetical protein